MLANARGLACLGLLELIYWQLQPEIFLVFFFSTILS